MLAYVLANLHSSAVKEPGYYQRFNPDISYDDANALHVYTQHTGPGWVRATREPAHGSTPVSMAA